MARSSSNAAAAGARARASRHGGPARGARPAGSDLRRDHALRLRRAPHRSDRDARRGPASFGPGRPRASRYAERRRAPGTASRAALVPLQAGRAPLLLRAADASRRARGRWARLGRLAALGVIPDLHLLLQPHALLRAGTIRVPRVARPYVPLRTVRVPRPSRRDGSLGAPRGPALVILLGFVATPAKLRPRY